MTALTINRFVSHLMQKPNRMLLIIILISRLLLFKTLTLLLRARQTTIRVHTKPTYHTVIAYILYACSILEQFAKHPDYWGSNRIFHKPFNTFSTVSVERFNTALTC
ncbi:MAG: hypothetical protein GY868_16705 [Deltaproteobacteria bacterium]|nr:hypothetical protein [Deltaproteobacteria bacterium]